MLVELRVDQLFEAHFNSLGEANSSFCAGWKILFFLKKENLAIYTMRAPSFRLLSDVHLTVGFVSNFLLFFQPFT